MENTVSTVSPVQSAKKDYMIAAAQVIAIIVGFFVLQLTMYAVGQKIGIAEKSYFQYILVLIPLHIIVGPLVYFFGRVKNNEKLEKKSISAVKLIGIIPIIYTTVFAGSMISTVLAMLLSDSSAQNIASLTTGDNDFFRILVIGITAPIIEELLFRKLLIDRLYKHSEIVAVIFSAVSFGLFHMNITQFFYATFIGIVLGIVYVKTGKIIYTIILHMVVNLGTSAVSATLLKLGDQYVAIWSAFIVLLGIAGVFLFIFIYRKSLKFTKHEDITNGQTAKAGFLNPVSIVLFVILFAFMVLSVVMPKLA